VDKTGLKGEYNMKLEYQFVLPGGGPGGPAAGPGPPPVPTEPLPPALTTALQEQFGVKLQSGKSTADVLNIDSADHPSENWRERCCPGGDRGIARQRAVRAGPRSQNVSERGRSRPRRRSLSSVAGVPRRFQLRRPRASGAVPRLQLPHHEPGHAG